MGAGAFPESPAEGIAASYAATQGSHSKKALKAVVRHARSRLTAVGLANACIAFHKGTAHFMHQRGKKKR